MTTVKVECSCGQRFAFDVEPVHGRMPAPVACPACGTDGTAAANTILAAQTAVASVPQPQTRATAVQQYPPAQFATAPASQQYASAPQAYAGAPQPIAAQVVATPARARLAVAVPAAAPASPPPIPAGRPAPAGTPIGRPVPRKPARGNDGWAADETSFNKMGMYLIMIPSVVAGLLTWGIFGVLVPIPILATIVGVCGLAGGIVNILGRGPIWAGALVGLTMGLGGYGAVSWWVHDRPSVYKYEMAIAFIIGAAPGFGLQFALQQILRKTRGNAV